MSAVADNGKFTATAGGWGWFLGGDGSGVWLGREVLRAVLADLDGLGPATMLTARLTSRMDRAIS
jgi:glucosamine kinase